MENSLIQNTNSLKNLPSDWRVFPFTNLIDDVSGGNLKTQKSEFLENGLIPIIDQGKDLIAGYIDDENVIVKTKTPHIVFGDHTRILKYIDFPFAMGADGTKVLKVKSNIEALEKYVYYFFQTLNIPETGYNRHFKYLKECLIPLPNLATQQKIANILDKADELRQYNKQLIEKYEALTQSLFLDMFGDPVKNEKGWNLTKFSNVLTKIESGWSPVCENYSRRDENEWAVLKLGAVSYGTYNPNENKKYEFDIPNSKIDCEVKQGDLLFTRKNTYHMVGKTAFVYETESRLLLPDTVFRLVYNLEKANPLFLYYLLNHSKFSSEIQSLASGTSGSMPNISKAKLLAKDLICPSVELQNQFAERVAIIETQKQQAQEALAKNELLFQGLLQQAFNGELNTPPYGHPS